jgi:hypothetical protein
VTQERRELVIFMAGNVLGQISCFTAAELREAASSPDLRPEYRRSIAMLADLRDKVFGEVKEIDLRYCDHPSCAEEREKCR